jgi:hypothetical protein
MIAPATGSSHHCHLRAALQWLIQLLLKASSVA